MGSLADKKCVQGQRVSGILVKKNFNYHILTPSDLSSGLLSRSLLHTFSNFYQLHLLKKDLCFYTFQVEVLNRMI